MSHHAWCSDPARDEAVRAAEDGRSGQLPTLEECIERQKHAAMKAGVVNGFVIAEGAVAMIPKSVSATSAPEQENKGDGMATNGLRTDRVTLEITQRADRFQELAAWDWPRVLDGLDRVRGESVRVVEEERPGVMDEDGDRIEMTWSELAHFYQSERDVARSERDKAIRDLEECRQQLATKIKRVAPTSRPAEAESVWPGEKVAELTDCLVDARKVAEQAISTGSQYLRERDAAIREREELRGRVETLETAIKAAALEIARLNTAPAASGAANSSGETVSATSGWLTEEERRVIKLARNHFYETCDYPDDLEVVTLDDLLARSTPPEVVLPTVFQRSILGDPLVALEQVKAALAAAGVTCKEAR